MEAISVAKAIEEKEKKTNSTPTKNSLPWELQILLEPSFKPIPPQEGFSRTAVNYEAGAKSGIAALFSALVVGLTLLFLPLSSTSSQRQF